MNLPIKATKVFYRNRNSTAQIVINRGGSRSSKTFSIAQLLFLERFFTQKNKKFLILRKTLPSLRLSVYQDFKKFVNQYNLENIIEENKQFLDYYYRPNNNYLHFGSLDDSEKIKSSSWNYIWMNEATDFDEDDLLQLLLRLSEPTEDGKRNQLFMCFNPIDEYHWIKTKVLDKKGIYDLEEIHSTYKDNPFLSEDYTKLVESYLHIDFNKYKVYALGEWGKLENLIYTNWDTTNEYVNGGEVIYGLDFGYTNPSALLKIVINDKDIFEEELIYQTELTNAQLIEKCDELKVSKTFPIYADSAEPDRIQEFREAGYNVIESVKDVINSIDFVKRFKIHCYKPSANLIKEKMGYSRRKDKNGRLYEEPAPNIADHCYDKETQILTESGWKYFKDLDFTDKVMTLNKNKIVYEKPIKLIKQKYTGNMIRYNSKNLDFSITPDQLLLTANQYSTKIKKCPEFNFTSINNLPFVSFIKRNCDNWVGNYIPDFVFTKLANKYQGKYIIPSIIFARFLGLWLAEGCVNRNHYAVIIDGNGEDILNVIKSLNVPYTKIVTKCNVNRYYIMAKEFYNYFRLLGDSFTKCIPLEYKNGTKDILRALWEGYWLGDGAKKSLNKEVSSVSLDLVSDFQEVLFKLGISSNVYKILDSRETYIIRNFYKCSPVYRLSLSYENKGVNGLGCVELVKSKLFEEKYDDFVYDVRVNSGIIVVRRNGRIMWTSNCMNCEQYALYSHLRFRYGNIKLRFI